jgi:hypothetical protein
LFAESVRPVLCRATADLGWLLTRGYSAPAALKLVGDRYQLSARQRMAVGRAACSDGDLARRKARQVPIEALLGGALAVDGYNVLTTVEAALAGGAVLLARDGTYRDMASMHGSFRRVAETLPALELLGRTLADLGVAQCRWFLDRPVSNSGRLKTLMREVADAAGWPWIVELVPSPDHVLAQSTETVATADHVILDRCARWFNLARETVSRHVPGAWIVDLSDANLP